MDAFDADVLIYAAVPGHPLGEQVAALFRSAAPATVAGIGSVLLLPEVLAKPLRDDATDEVRILAALLARLDLRPVDRATAELATALSSRYRLKAADATHLATAVGMGADRFITNNKRDFPPTITEIQVTYPAISPTPPRQRTRTRYGHDPDAGSRIAWPRCSRNANRDASGDASAESPAGRPIPQWPRLEARHSDDLTAGP